MQQLYLNNFFYKNPTTGEFIPIAGIAGESAYEIAVRLGTFTGTEEEWNNYIAIERDKAIADIIAKATEARESIPEDYTALAEQVEEIKSDIDDFPTSYSNAIKKTASGDDAVYVSDVSPIPHKINITVEYPEGTDPTTLKIRAATKNLITYPYSFSSGMTKNGITATVQEDGGIRLNGTYNGTEDRTWFTLSDNSILNSDGRPVNFKISHATKYNDGTKKSLRFVANSSNGNTSDDVADKWFVYSVAGGKTYLAVMAGTYDEYVLYPQIEIGQVSSEFEIGSEYRSIALDENGVGEFVSFSQSMTIWSETDGVSIKIEYVGDINSELNGLKQNERLEEYGLPVLYISGDTYKMSKDREISMEYRYGEMVGTCTMKWQGSSSLAHPKKNYTIKFDRSFEAKEGWGEQKKYCLKANYVDASHARNIVSARIWGDFVRTRTVPNERLLELPNCGAIDGFPIIIALNGEFHGLYTFNIPKDGWMFGMGTGTQEAILCADSLNDGTGACAFKEEATLDGDFEVEYASDEDDTDWIKQSINTLINAVINAKSADDLTTISQYVDIDSAVDYYLHTVFTHGIDNFSRNYLLATYDGVKWYFTGYDMDLTFGLSAYNGIKYLPSTSSNGFTPFADAHNLMKYIFTHHRDLLKNRYRQLREEGYPLYEDQPSKIAIMFIEDIPQEVYGKDRDKWRGIRYTSVNNYNQITEFMRQRLKYMDSVLGE